MLGNTEASGICHSFSSDGRCISLLKILLTNVCIYDCQYCINRKSNDVSRATFTPREVADLTINFYKRNYIEGLFLSSGIIKSPDYTMEQLYNTLYIIRNEYKFNGYIHVKSIPNADKELINKTGYLADRMSINIELPSESSLKLLAPNKTKQSILTPMRVVKNNILMTKNEIVLYKHAPKYVPAGQSTQLIIGATPDSDKKIINLAENLYKKLNLKRVFYSAYIPSNSNNPLLSISNPPLLREHRLYQADWLIRYYGFKGNEILKNEDENLNLNLDPKCHWAINNLHLFPIEINTADYYEILRVPGIGVISANKIVKARKAGKLNFENLKKMGIVLKRAKYFITCSGKTLEKINLIPNLIEDKLGENKIEPNFKQISIFDNNEKLLLS